MSKVTSSNNLRQEDFSSQSSWIGPLFTILNSFITSVTQILDGNIDFQTNIKSVSKEFDTSTLTFPLVFQWPFTQVQPVSLYVCKAIKGNSAVALIPAWTYNASTSEISVAYLGEISSVGISLAASVGARYRFTIRASV